MAQLYVKCEGEDDINGITSSAPTLESSPLKPKEASAR